MKAQTRKIMLGLSLAFCIISIGLFIISAAFNIIVLGILSALGIIFFGILSICFFFKGAKEFNELKEEHVGEPILTVI